MVTINKVLRGLTPLTARSIIKFVGSKEAEEGIGWFTGKELDNIFGDETNSNSLQEKLKNIQQEFEDIKLITSMKKTKGTEWEHLQTRLLQAEMGVCHKFQLLQTILANKESNDKRDIEVKRLRYEILDPSYGILNNLSVIHQELVGHIVNPTKKGLLEIWYNEVCNNMNENPSSAKTCYDILMKFLTKAAILQLKGFLLFKGANANSDDCLKKFKTFESNLKSQSDSMDKTISDTMKYLADPSKENVFYLRKTSGVRFKPFVKREPLVYEYNLKYIAEEKWIFEKSSRFNEDGSLIISGSPNGNGGKGSYIGLQDNGQWTDKAVCVSKVADAHPFFVMPIDKENSTTITICTWKSESQSARFLGNNLEFVKKKDNIEFTMTKPEDIPKKEHGWNFFYKK